PATLPERALEVGEEIVLEGLRGEGGHGEATTVVVEGCVDDETRTVAGCLPRGDVLEEGVLEEALPEDLGERLGGEGRVDPAEGEQWPPYQGGLEVLADVGTILLEECPVTVGQRSVGIEHLDVPAWLLQGVVGRRDAAPGHARHVRDLVDDRGAVG